jgi:hypothetical protein
MYYYLRGDTMTKLCPRGKAAAKRKFKVYPSAYANAYASKICAGKIKDPSGVKRKDFKGPKPAKLGGVMKTKKETQGMALGYINPQETGSYLEQDIDGDKSFTNASVIAYYKGMV